MATYNICAVSALANVYQSQKSQKFDKFVSWLTELQKNIDFYKNSNSMSTDHIYPLQLAFIKTKNFVIKFIYKRNLPVYFKRKSILRDKNCQMSLIETIWMENQ